MVRKLDINVTASAVLRAENGEIILAMTVKEPSLSQAVAELLIRADAAATRDSRAWKSLSLEILPYDKVIPVTPK